MPSGLLSPIPQGKRLKVARTHDRMNRSDPTKTQQRRAPLRGGPNTKMAGATASSTYTKPERCTGAAATQSRDVQTLRQSLRLLDSDSGRFCSPGTPPSREGPGGSRMIVYFGKSKVVGRFRPGPGGPGRSTTPEASSRT